MDQLVIYKEPYGVVLVLGSWNYPFHLTLVPVVGAIGSGNCVIIKPSEVSPASAATMAKLIPKYLDKVSPFVLLLKTQQLLRFSVDRVLASDFISCSFSFLLLSCRTASRSYWVELKRQQNS